MTGEGHRGVHPACFLLQVVPEGRRPGDRPVLRDLGIRLGDEHEGLADVLLDLKHVERPSDDLVGVRVVASVDALLDAVRNRGVRDGDAHRRPPVRIWISIASLLARVSLGTRRPRSASTATTPVQR